jgi:hypothetical protein
MDVKSKEVLSKNEKVLKAPVDLEAMVSDLKVLGRREYQHLLRLHHKYQTLLHKTKLEEEKKEKAKEKAEAEPVDADAELDKQLESTILRIQKEKKRQEKKERILKAKSDLRKKMSVIASNGADGNDEDLFLSDRLWDKVRKKGFERVDENTDSDEEDDESDDSELGSDD